MLLLAACPACGAPGSGPCPACLALVHPPPPPPVPPPLAELHALLAYEGPARELVARLKYRNVRAAAGWLAAGMAELVDPAGIDVVTWAPTTALRRGHRGFDQAELLARRIAAAWGRPCRSLLHRGPGPPQTGRTAVERSRGPSFLPRGTVPGWRVALVDDVVTTGATLGAAGRALRAAGAGSLVGLAAAHRP